MKRYELDMIRYELGGKVAGLMEILEKLEKAIPAELPRLSDENKALGYAVKRIDGTHDGMGNEYIMVTLNDQPILNGIDRVSADAHSWINGFIAGHARALGSTLA